MKPKTKTEEEIFNDLCMKHQITFTDDRFNSAHLDWGELFAFYNATILQNLKKENPKKEVKQHQKPQGDKEDEIYNN